VIVEDMATNLESRRLALQDRLDARKDAAARNRMGQFSTPSKLAVDMLRYAGDCLRENEKVRFIDPALGTGAFYSALLEAIPESCIDAAVGYEIDRHYGDPAVELWQGAGLEIRLADFAEAEPPAARERFNLLICNPPYVRHHHIASERKLRLQSLVKNASGCDLNGLSGLYCHFLGLSHAWMAEGGLAGWLIPSEFMDVNYGKPVKRYLLEEVSLLHVHRFDPNDSQFRDALVSSAIVWIRNEKPRDGHEIRFTFGGTLHEPKLERLVPSATLLRESKWTRYPAKEDSPAADVPVLGDFFQIKRGLATGNNKFFILSADEIKERGLPQEAFKPILPSPRHLKEDAIEGDRNGNPLLDQQLYLLDPPWTEEEIRENRPSLWEYLEAGRQAGIAKRYVCSHRAPWYRQESRPPAPYVCTYLGRGDSKSGRPFRFILNNSQATAANVYLMLYPHGPVARALRDRPAAFWPSRMAPNTLVAITISSRFAMSASARPTNSSLVPSE